MPHQYSTASGTFRLVQAAGPDDDFRGGVSAKIIDDGGGHVANLQVYCHPDFPGYDACCQLSSDAMLAAAAERLQKTGHDAIVLGSSHGAAVGMFLNPPGGDAP